MNNLLEKTHLLQFIILLLFYILSNKFNNNNLLYKDSYYYNFLRNIVKYNKITEKYIKFIKKNKDLPIENNHILLQNNEYFYLFYNKYNIYIYFFKETNSNIHNIYFNGINNKKDLGILIDTILKLLSSNYNFEYISNIINKNGNLYKILPNKISKVIFLENNILKNNSLIDTFEYIFNKEYDKLYNNNDELYNDNDSNNDDINYNDSNNDNESDNDSNNDNESNNDSDNDKLYNDKINININGFSLGGVLSQVFVHNLLELENYKDRLNIQLFNIESWFGGDENDFNEFKKKIDINNIYNKNSIFYLYNKIYQPYFNNNKQLEDDNKEIEDDTLYKQSPFPCEIIKYINKYHFLSKIIK